KDRLPFLQILDYGPSVAYMADVYSYDMCLWGQVVMDEGTLRMKVIDCYWGDAEPGDLRPLPKINYHSADSHLVEGSEWFLMGSMDGNNSFQVDAYTVYRVENGRVKNLSYYDDVLQYDGWTPDELALQVGRILAKYCSES
ncbi:MAG: hypothetical protein IKU11_12545, partial [Clostridia bacterium]|nr:hypothetical protein [Clostridia bacterium]